MRRFLWIMMLYGLYGFRTGKANEIPELAWPTEVSGWKISQDFGVSAKQPGRSFDSNVRHAGLDIHVSHGKPVYAAYDGKVVWAKDRYLPAKDVPHHPHARKAVVIEHRAGGETFTTSYGHVNFSVKEGDIVRGGQQIGTVADWGSNTHLHFGVRKSDFASNPSLAIAGRVASDAELKNFVDPFRHYLDPKIDRAASHVSSLFNRTTPGVSLQNATRSTPPFFTFLVPQVPVAQAAQEDTDVTQLFLKDEEINGQSSRSIMNFGHLTLALPEGWQEGKRDTRGVIFGPGGTYTWDRNVQIQCHPGFPGTAYTPSAIQEQIIKFSLGADGDAVKRGIVRMEASGVHGVFGSSANGRSGVVLQHVLFSYSGRVYMISTVHRPGDTETPKAFRVAVRSLSLAGGG